VFGAVLSCTGAASCCCRVWVVLLMCAGCSAGSPGGAVRCPKLKWLGLVDSAGELLHTP
ncbi:hypothetical protein SOVF_130250, partial [Spinacia oleracea]